MPCVSQDVSALTENREPLYYAHCYHHPSRGCRCQKGSLSFFLSLGFCQMSISFILHDSPRTLKRLCALTPCVLVHELPMTSSGMISLCKVRADTCPMPLHLRPGCCTGFDWLLEHTGSVALSYAQCTLPAFPASPLTRRLTSVNYFNFVVQQHFASPTVIPPAVAELHFAGPYHL